MQTSTPDPTRNVASAAALPTSEPTRPLPTSTHQQALIVLLAPSGSDAALSAALQDMLGKAARQAGLRFQVLPQLSELEMAEKLALVAVLPPDPGLAMLAAKLPDTPFLAVGIPDLQPAANVTSLAAHGGLPDQQGFLAGYLAAAITTDWRVGLVVPKEGAGAQAARLAFSNGFKFFCGLCRASYPPFYEYPQVVELSSGASPAEQQATADYLADHAVQTVYIFPGAGDEALPGYLAKAGVNVIGGISRPAGLEANWVATIQPELLPAIETLIPQLLAGTGAGSLEMPLVISDINPDLFSPGRQLLVQKLLADLLAGYVDTGAGEQTGEPR